MPTCIRPTASAAEVAIYSICEDLADAKTSLADPCGVKGVVYFWLVSAFVGPSKPELLATFTSIKIP